MVRNGPGRHPGGNLPGLGGGTRPQAVVDRQGDGFTAGRSGPIRRQQRQGHAVGTAGNRHGQARSRLERPQTGHCGGKCRRIDHLHSYFCFSATAARLTRSGMPGWSLNRMVKAVQASFFLPC